MKKPTLWITIALVFTLISALPADAGSTDAETMQEISRLYKAGEFQQALDITEKALAKNKNALQFLEARYYLLLQLKREDEALATALRREELGPKTKPWICMDIAGHYMRQGNSTRTLDWLEKAVQRGFTGISTLMDESYSSLRETPRFESLIRAMKDRIGIGKPARDFSVTLLDGKPFSLSAQKGKVILVDFWATWCGPCRREIPELKKIYSLFKEKGFDIIGVSLDRSRDDLTTYIEENELEWPVSFSGDGWKDATAGLYGVRSIPSFWLIDRKGTLRHFDLRKDALKKAISELLAESPQ